MSNTFEQVAHIVLNVGIIVAPFAVLFGLVVLREWLKSWLYRDPVVPISSISGRGRGRPRTLPEGQPIGIPGGHVWKRDTERPGGEPAGGGGGGVSFALTPGKFASPKRNILSIGRNQSKAAPDQLDSRETLAQPDIAISSHSPSGSSNIPWTR